MDHVGGIGVAAHDHVEGLGAVGYWTGDTS
jgi:hypothetical protein